MSKEIKLTQDSQEWHDWRNGGLGASESAVIMGSLPFEWNDVLKLWKLKVGMVESDFVMNEAMQAGKDLEPEARRKYIKATGIKVKAACYQHDEFPFLRASLDGINKNSKHIVEIKCSGLPTWQKVKKGFMAPYYYAQVMQQMCVSGATSAHYWVYRKAEGGVLVNIPRNDDYIEELVRRAKIFWECVESKTPCLPRHLGINMLAGDSDPYIAGNIEVEPIGVYKN